MKKYRSQTLAVHAGYSPDSDTHSVVPPIHQTTAYSFDDTEYAKELFELKRGGNIYTRLQNPTSDAFELRMAALDGGVAALSFASGHAAIFSSLFNLASAGDEIVSSINIYGGAVNLLDKSLRRLGLSTTFVNPDDLNAWENAVTDKTKAFFVETVGNPNANVADIEKIAQIAHKYGIPFLVDSTFTTPALLRPIELGADFVIHSATKFIGGHGTSMGGVVVDSGNFVFKGNPRFPDYNAPDPSYHGIVFADLGSTAFITRLRTLILRDFGACISPFNSFLLMQGLQTLSLRMERHSQNAQKTAEFLEQHQAVRAVHYPGLKSSPYYELTKRILPQGAGSVFTFEIEGGREAAARFIDSLELVMNVANVGDVRSLVIHPATTTHSQLSDEQLLACGIAAGTIRLSVGIEDISDILEDIESALQKAVQ